MSTGNPLVLRQSILAAKTEVAAGTAVALAAADAAMNIFNAELQEDIQEIPLVGQSAFSGLGSVHGTRMGRLTFQSWLHGNGGLGSPLYATTLFGGCGMADAGGVFSFQSANAAANTLTMGLYEDGLKRGIAGAMGTFALNFNTGGPPLIEWEFVGKLIDESDVALLDPTYPTTDPPRFAGATVTIGAFTPIVSQLIIRAGNELAMRLSPTDATGYLAACIVDRNTRGTLDPEATLVAGQDWMAKLTAHTKEALSVVVGSVANNIMTIGAPKVQVVKKNRANRNKVQTNALELMFARSAAGGDDELTITFT